YKPLHGDGVAHAFANTLLYLDRERTGFDYPILPVTVNCYGRDVVRYQGGGSQHSEEADPPAPSPRRCFELGRATARILRESPWRGVVMASSGWSHAFLTEQTHFLSPDPEARGPEQLIFGDRPDPEAGPGDVLIRVRGSAVNHADLAIRAGRSATGGLPRILGLDIAGEIARLGPGVTGWKEGERVVVENRVKCGTCTPCVQGRDEYCERQKRLGGELDGGHAQYCKVPAANLQRIPEWMGFEEAATLPLAGHTAWHCLVERVKLQPWEDVLINAVGSGVGSFGLLMAKGIGARAIVTAGSDWKLEKAKELGANEAVNY